MNTLPHYQGKQSVPYWLRQGLWQLPWGPNSEVTWFLEAAFRCYTDLSATISIIFRVGPLSCSSSFSIWLLGVSTYCFPLLLGLLPLPLPLTLPVADPPLEECLAAKFCHISRTLAVLCLASISPPPPLSSGMGRAPPWDGVAEVP